MNGVRTLASVACALWLVGCGKSSHEGATAEPMASALAPSSYVAAISMIDAGAPPAVTVETQDEPPNERRAERKAATEITRSNYKTELSKLQKELAAP